MPTRERRRTVAVSRSSRSTTFRRHAMSILISYDGSPSAKHALAVAAAVMPASRVTLMHVWNPPDPILHDSFGAPDVVAGASGRSLDRRAWTVPRRCSQKAGRSRWVSGSRWTAGSSEQARQRRGHDPGGRRGTRRGRRDRNPGRRPANPMCSEACRTPSSTSRTCHCS